MKVREGFVSNSSSSSFIVRFSKSIETKEDLAKELFGNCDLDEIYIYDKYMDITCTKNDAISELFGCKKIITNETIIEHAYDFIGDEEAIIDYDNNPFRINHWDVIDLFSPYIARDTYERIMSEFPGSSVYQFELGNEMGSISAELECSDIFSDNILVCRNKH